MEKKKLLVLCTGNSCRSQMAEGYLRHFAGNRAEIFSAGIEAHGVNPHAIAIMKEDGIDISGHTSNLIEDYDAIGFDYIITVCDNANENCPYFPSQAQRFHHSFPDPAKAAGDKISIAAAFRKVRAEIKEFARTFAEDYL